MKAAPAVGVVAAIGVTKLTTIAPIEEEIIEKITPIDAQLSFVGNSEILAHPGSASSPLLNYSRILIDGKETELVHSAELTTSRDFCDFMDGSRVPTLAEYTLDLDAYCDPSLMELMYTNSSVRIQIIPAGAQHTYEGEFLLRQFQPVFLP